MKLLNFLLFLSISTCLAQPYRPSSRPFITGDAFRSVADYVFDDATTNLDPTNPANNPPCVDATADLDPASIKSGDIIFTRLVRMDHFAKNIAPKITVPYILVSHNSVHDWPAPGAHKPLLESENLIAWFGQNCDLVCEHPKFIPIPIGLSNKHWSHSSEHGRWLQRFRFMPPCEKNILLYANVNVTTNVKVRKPILDFFKQKSFCFFSPLKPYFRYLEDLAHAKFTLSPHGGGLDCHRTWEALYMGSFPLVKTSSLDPLYKDLPVLIVDHWEQVTAEFLEQKYEELMQGTYRYEKLYFDYWENLIRSYQQPYRE